MNPVRAGSPAATARRLGTVLPPLHRKRKDLPAELCAALDRALAPRPEDRGTLDELADELAEGLTDVSDEGGTILAHPLERPAHRRAAARRRPDRRRRGRRRARGGRRHARAGRAGLLAGRGGRGRGGRRRPAARRLAGVRRRARGPARARPAGHGARAARRLRGLGRARARVRARVVAARGRAAARPGDPRRAPTRPSRAAPGAGGSARASAPRGCGGCCWPSRCSTRRCWPARTPPRGWEARRGHRARRRAVAAAGLRARRARRRVGARGARAAVARARAATPGWTSSPQRPGPPALGSGTAALAEWAGADAAARARRRGGRGGRARLAAAPPAPAGYRGRAAMSVLRNLESKLAGLVEGTFSRAFKSEVRPVEIARKLTREMEENKVQSLSRTYAPNEYAVWLSPDDRKQFEGYERDLATELSGYLLEHARRERIALVTSPKITLPHRRPAAAGRVRHPGAARAPLRGRLAGAQPGRRGPHDGLHGLRPALAGAARARPPARQGAAALRGQDRGAAAPAAA